MFASFSLCIHRNRSIALSVYGSQTCVIAVMLYRVVCGFDVVYVKKQTREVTELDLTMISPEQFMENTGRLGEAI